MSTGADVAPLPDSCWPVNVTEECVPDWNATRGNTGEPVYTTTQKQRAVALAGMAMRMLTGYRLGGCPVTVRPCSRSCSAQTWRTYPAAGPGWGPTLVGGSWFNVGCADGCGSCATASAIDLPRPCYGVTEVRLDGAVLDPSSYTVYDGRLIRTDGEAWPLAQDLTLPDTEAGTWSVTYLPSALVDGLGAYAAGRLAGEFVKACAGQDCALPPNVTSIARNGVTMTLGLGVFPDRRTGIREVDTYVEAVNPHGLVAPTVVYSPDLPRHAVQGQVVGYRPPGQIIDGGTP